MNPEEARLILQCRRPAGQDDRLPAITEAWQTLNGHPEIRAALEADALVDGEIGRKLRSLDPPADLRGLILAGARVTPRLAWWRRRGAFLAAAALIIGGVAAWQLRPLLRPAGTEVVNSPVPATPPASLEEFRQDTTDKVSNDGIHLAHLSRHPSELQAWLSRKSKTPPAEVPPGLSSLATHGCEIFQWKGREVTLMCFETGSGTVHLFTMDAADIDWDLSQPQVASANGLETLTWKQNGRIMLLTAQAPPDQLRRLALPG